MRRVKTTWHGSCHCKAVTFEADIDLDQGTGKCNCTLCWKQRMWKAKLDSPADFRLISGADVLGDYAKHGEGHEDHHRFCRLCGISTHNHGTMELLGGDFVFVQMAALDDLPVEVLLAAPLTIVDGRHDRWTERPDEVRHL